MAAGVRTVISLIVVGGILGATINHIEPISYELDRASRLATVIWTGYLGAAVVLTALIRGTAVVWSRRVNLAPIQCALLAGATIMTVLLIYALIVVQRLPRGFGVPVVITLS